MSEFELNFRKFDKLINPENKKVYCFKDLNKAHLNYWPTFFNLDELLIEMQNNSHNFGIDLSQLEMIFIDSDSKAGTDDLKSFFNYYNIKYILITSQIENHAHFYLKRTEKTLVGPIKKFMSVTIHDYYKKQHKAPYSPVLPREENGREFLIIPEKIDFIPDEIWK